MASAVITFTVTQTKYAYNAIPASLAYPTGHTLATPDFAQLAEDLRRKVADDFLAIDPLADAHTTVVVTYA